MTFTDAGGEIPTTADVENALQQITYANASDTPPASVVLDWVLDDGNTGAQGSGGAGQVVGSTTVTITAVNDAPVLVNNALTINEGGSVILGAAELSATDADTAAGTLVFSVSSISGGRFEFVASPGVSITSFTQQEVTNGDVQFVHVGRETAPAYSVTVSDGSLSDGPAAASITFSNVNDAPAFHAAGAPVFASNDIATDADGAQSVRTADVDGDGDLDVLSASREDDRIVWYENDGSESFTARTIATDANGAWAVTTADVDGDGDLDVLSASVIDDRVVWYENDGSENFTANTIASDANGARVVTTADVDGDGDLDVLSASFSDNRIVWYENDGSENFTARTIAADASGVQSVTPADVDGDGDLDVLSALATVDRIVWYENDGSEGFTARTIATDADGANSVTTADVDGDGDVDVLSSSSQDGRIVWYENNGSESFTVRTIAADAVGAREVTTADVDGDGDLDVLSASYFDDRIVWYENNPSTLDDNPTFVEGGAAVVLDGNVTVSEAELDALNGGNGNYDGALLIVARTDVANSDDVFGFADGNGLTLVGGDLIKNGQIVASFDTSSTAGELVVTFTDANGETPTTANVENVSSQITYANASDGPPASVQLDWVLDDGNTGSQGAGGASQATGSTTVTITAVNDAPVLVNNALTITEGESVVLNATELSATDAETAAGALAFSVSSISGGRFERVATPGISITSFTQQEVTDGDVQFVHFGGETAPAYSVTVSDGSLSDGPSAASVTFTNVNEAPAFHAAGAPVFASHDISTNADGAISVTTADVDGDGDLDVLSASVGDNKIVWYENDGSENFTARTIATDADGAMSVTTADVDGDGDVDVLSASNIDDRIVWYENDGSESFTTRTIAANADGARAVTTADVDGDGDVDVLSASTTDDRIVWYENDGSESFTTRTIATDADGAMSVTTADVDGDGDVDVLSASNIDDRIVWYENDGSESFSTHTIATDADGPRSVTTADVDGDGDVDVLSASTYDDRVAWYENDGSESFTTHTIATDANGAAAVNIADVDGDGDVDVLSASNFDDRIVWYENNPSTLDGNPTFVEGGAAVLLDGDVSVSDTELDALNGGNGNYTGAELSLVRTGAANTEDVFGFTDGNGLTLVGGNLIKNGQSVAVFDTSSTAGELVVTFTDAGGEIPTTSDVENALQQINYANTSDTPPASVLLDWVLDDGNSGTQGSGGAEQITGSTTVAIQNSADLQIVAPTTDSAIENTPLVFTGANEVQVYDGISLFDSPMRVSLSVANGTLQLANLTGIDIIEGADGSGSMVIDGLKSDLNTALNGLIFTPNANYNGADTLSITTAIAAGLEGHYTFEGNADDQSAGTTFNGTPNGNAAIVSDAERGQVLSLDGDDDFVQIAGLLGDPANVTLSSWVDLSSIDASGAVLISMGSSPALYFQTDGTLIGFYESGGTNNVIQSTESLLGTGWRHVAVSIDATNSMMTLYVDGVVVDTSTTIGAIEYDNSPDTYIGRAGDGLGGFDLDGMIDDARIYSRALSGDEIAALATDQTDVSDSVAITIDAVNDAPRFHAAGVPVFVTHDIATDAVAAWSVTTADVDGDGDVDVLSASYSDDRIVWYENDGNESFITHTIASNADGAYSVTTSDVDGDGDVDVLSASNLDDRIVWYENDGSESFTARDIAADADGARSVTTADVDGDGDVDVLSASYLDNRIVWYENDGSESFTAHTIATDASNAQWVTTADVDGDGDVDVLSASITDDRIVWYENDGSESFTTRTIVADADGATSVTTADVDGDGDLDVLSASAFDDRIVWYENDGGENFTTHTIASDADAAYLVATADVDGDGDLDVLSASSNDDRIVWYENDGSESFTAHTIASDADSAISVTTADVDGDGDLDVLSASSDDNRIAWYENNPSTLDGNPTFVENGAAVVLDTDVAVFDADLDALNGGNGNYAGAELSVVRTGAANAEDEFSFTDGNGLTLIGGNLIKNGQSVAVFDTSSNAGELVVTFTDAGGEIPTTADVENALRQIAYANASDAPPASVLLDWVLDDGNTGSQGSGGAGQVNGSTTVTITTVNDAPVLVNNALTIAEGGTVVLSGVELSATDAETAAGALAFSVTSVSGGRFERLGATGVAITSFTQQEVTDGDVQFVHDGGATAPAYSVTVSDGSLSDGPSAASITFTKVNEAPNFYAAGAPTFTAHDIATDADGAWSVTTADVDGDGDVDALSASFFDDRIVWYENDGSENFTTHTIVTDADGAISVTTADVDGDGDVDVLSASEVDDRIVWYENDGSESFTTHTIAAYADVARSVTTADMDGDGDVDVLSASYADDRIVWYENDGSESFTTGTIATDADGAWSVTTADVDGDGDGDVLSASDVDDRIVWYENDGSESFTTHTIAADADGARSVTTADMDGDGDVDVLSASANDDRIVWYENDGSESFTTHTIASDANGAFSATTADVDGDGDLDVLSASYLDDRIVWYETDGSESFTANTIATDADAAYSVTTADVDGDGDVDVLSASRSDDRIVWYENDLNTLDGNPTYLENGPAVVLDGDVAVSDAELEALNGGSGNYAGAELSVVRTGAANAEDVFGFNDGNGLTLVGGNVIKNGQSVAVFDTSSNAGELVVTFTDAGGEIPTTADAENALRQITYGDTSDTPPASVQLDWVLDDGNTSSQGSGGAGQVGGSTTVTITAVNDAPMISTTDLLVNGDLETGDLTGWTTTGTVGNASNALVFGGGNAPSPHTAEQSFGTAIGQAYTLTFSYREYNGLLNQRMQVTVDGATNNFTAAQISATAGSTYVNYSYTFVADSTTSTLTFTDVSPSSINDDGYIDNVVVAEIPTVTAITEDDRDNAGDTVATLIASAGGDLITDVDTGAVEGIAVVDASSAFDYSLDGGASWQRMANVSSTYALLLRPSDLIRFVPNEIASQTEDIEFRAWDQTSGVAGTYVSTSLNGGAHAYSADTASMLVVTTDVNDTPSFGSEGGFAVGYGEPGYNQNVASLALADGSVLFTPYDASNNSQIGKLGADGQLDLSFGNDGYFTSSSIDYIRDIKQQADGKFLVTGYAGLDVGLARYNADGTLDATFGTGGVVITNLTSNDGGHEVAVHTDGSIVVVGDAGADSVVARYTSAGVLDTTLTINLGGSFERLGSVTILPDGRILAAGESHVIRLTTAVALDTTFDTDGILNVGHKANSLVVQADGSIAITGLSGDDLVVTRFDSDGVVDAAFGVGGTATWTHPSVFVAYGVKIIQQSDGKLLVVGTAETNSAFGYEMAVVRFNTDGTPDTAFGSNGSWLSGLTEDFADGYDVSLYDDGGEEKIVVGGFDSQFGNSRPLVARLNADGSLDTDFQSGQLDGSPTFVEGGTAVVLDGNVQIFDSELAADEDFSGATLTLARDGGADGDDVFSATGNLVLNAGTLELNGSDIGTYSNAGGQLVLTFANGVGNEQINEAMQSVAYANTSDAPPPSVQIGWTFSDGNTGVQGGR